MDFLDLLASQHTSDCVGDDFMPYLGRYRHYWVLLPHILLTMEGKQPGRCPGMPGIGLASHCNSRQPHCLKRDSRAMLNSSTWKTVSNFISKSSSYEDALQITVSASKLSLWCQATPVKDTSAPQSPAQRIWPTQTLPNHKSQSKYQPLVWDRRISDLTHAAVPQGIQEISRISDFDWSHSNHMCLEYATQINYLNPNLRWPWHMCSSHPLSKKICALR